MRCAAARMARSDLGEALTLQGADDLDVRAPAELIDGGDACEREAVVDQHLHVAREGRRVAGDVSDAAYGGAGDLFGLQARARARWVDDGGVDLLHFEA